MQTHSINSQSETTNQAPTASTFEHDISRSLSQSAFGGVSFNPERRGASFVAEYAATLAEDYAIFKAQAEKGGTLDLLDGEFARYRAGYRKVNNAFLASESRCVSSMIAGPSNFPFRRMEKRNNVAHKRLNELVGFRERARAAIIRTLRPDLAPIMAGDADAIERLQAELSKAEILQSRMKRANAAIRKHKKLGAESQIEALMGQGFSRGIAAKLLEPDFCGRIGFADYQLTNNGANIRRMAARLETITTAKAKPVQTVETDNGLTIEDDPPANRIRVFFPGKPDAIVRDSLKSRGFRWSPTIGAWQAYRNHNAMEFVKTLQAPA